VVMLERCPGIITFASNDSVAAAVTVQPMYHDQSQARYQEAVFHPAPSQPHVNVQPKAHSAQPLHPYRRLQVVQVSQDGEGITLVLFTVEVPQTPGASHGKAVLPPDTWIAFQI
jgi:hypothetical protein